MKENKKVIRKQQQRNVKAKKVKISKQNRKSIVISIIAFIIVAYLLYTIYLLIKEPTNIFTVEEGNLYQEESDIGYVIRSEKVIKGQNYKNGMEQIKAEGERTGSNENIYRYYSINEESLKQKISELDTKIQEII